MHNVFSSNDAVFTKKFILPLVKNYLQLLDKTSASSQRVTTVRSLENVHLKYLKKETELKIRELIFDLTTTSIDKFTL